MASGAEFVRACEQTAAFFVTLDFTALTDERTLWTKGFLLEDRLRGVTIKIHSLIELEPSILYTTPHGSSLVRTSRTEALLAVSVVGAVRWHGSTHNGRCAWPFGSIFWLHNGQGRKKGAL